MLVLWNMPKYHAEFRNKAEYIKLNFVVAQREVAQREIPLFTKLSWCGK